LRSPCIYRDIALQHDVRIRLVTSNATKLPIDVIACFNNLEKATASCMSMQLNVCVSYGARDDIVNAARSLADRATRGEISPHEIDESAFSMALCTGGMRCPDLLIRTSEVRLSNFLLWELAYSELYFIPKLWPEITRGDLVNALREYAKRKRRFGR